MAKSITPKLFCIELYDGSFIETEVATTDPALMSSWHIMKELEHCVGMYNTSLNTKGTDFDSSARFYGALEDRRNTLCNSPSTQVQVNENKYELRSIKAFATGMDTGIGNQCYYSIIEATMVRQKPKVREDGKTYSGWRIHYTGYFYSVYEEQYKKNSPVFKKEFQHVLLVNETIDGVRLMWTNNKTKTPCWGMADTHIKEFSGILWRSPLSWAISDTYMLLQSIYPPSKVMPILQYVKPDKTVRHALPGLQLYGIGQRNLKVLSAWRNEGQNIKNLLNTVYGKSGIDGLSKNAFEGLEHIKTLDQLGVALGIVRSFKLLPSAFFDMVPHTFSIIHDLQSLDLNKEISVFVKTFVHNKETGISSKKLMGDITDVMRTDPRDLRYLLVDSVNMFKQIPRGNARRIVINHIRDQKLGLTDLHDYLVIESLKYQGLNRKLSYPKILKEFHNQVILPNITFHIAEDTHTLAEWGGIQNNCIGTYGDRVMDKTIYVVGFKDAITKHWIGHASLTPRAFEITQLLGKHNTRLEDDLNHSINKWIKENLQDNKKKEIE